MDAGNISAVAGPIVALAGIAFAAWNTQTQRRDQRQGALEGRQFTARAEVYVEALEYLYGVARGMAGASPLTRDYDDHEAVIQSRVNAAMTPEQHKERLRDSVEREGLIRAKVAAFGSEAVVAKFSGTLEVEAEFSWRYSDGDDDELERLVSEVRKRIRELEQLIRAELGPLIADQVGRVL